MKPLIHILIAIMFAFLTIETQAQNDQKLQYCTKHTCYIVNPEANNASTKPAAHDETSTKLMLRNLINEMHVFMSYNQFASNSSTRVIDNQRVLVSMNFEPVFVKYGINPNEVNVILSSKNLNEKGEVKEDLLVTANELKEGVVFFGTPAEALNIDVMFIMDEVSKEGFNWKNGYNQQLVFDVTLNQTNDEISNFATR